MNKPQLIDLIAKKGNISKAEAKRALELTLNSIIATLSKGEEISLIGFGSFKIVERSERMGVNPKTGAKIKIASKKVVRFKPGNELSGQVK
ncbi:MAG: HU family DNA-binding protein [Bacteroidales bacterium]|nr:HU family DNA-binding protein [Bacteroidales bacterium]